MSLGGALAPPRPDEVAVVVLYRVALPVRTISSMGHTEQMGKIHRPVEVPYAVTRCGKRYLPDIRDARGVWWKERDLPRKEAVALFRGGGLCQQCWKGEDL